MKKRIPQSVLRADHQAASPSHNVRTHYDIESTAQYHPSQSAHRHTPVTVDDLIDSIAERNRNAMQSQRQQKQQNRTALNSVLRSIFDEK